MVVVVELNQGAKSAGMVEDGVGRARSGGRAASCPLPGRRCPHFEQVVACAPQGPLPIDLLQATQEELAQTPSLFHLSEDRFGDLLAQGVRHPAPLRGGSNTRPAV